jgi:hypothetical protein
MKVACLLIAACAVLLMPPTVKGQGCRINSVDPESGKIGDTVGAVGEAIDKANVVELYLTDGSNDTKVVIVEQTDKLIKFKIPKTMKPGRYNLMIKTGGAAPKLLEQPVKMNVET